VFHPGTFVGIATGGSAQGKLFPAHAQTGALTLHFTSDDSIWGLPTSDNTGTGNTLTGGPVLPLGVVYMPIYSFNLQNQFINYKRNENVGILTDYIIQIPAITADEKLIQPGQKVMVSTSATEYGRQAELSSINGLMGRLMPWDGSASTERFCIGRCFNKIAFADGSASAGTKLSADTTYTLTSAGRAEFKGLDKVQTVPGLGLAGSGTKGVPGWLTDARADSSGTFYLLNILVRIS
jgi:hypothetical protein